MSRRVVVTGIGVVAPNGIGEDNFWNGIKEGKCAVDTVTRFDITDYPCKIAAEIKDFNISDYVDRKEARRMDRYTHYAMAASKMAMESANIKPEKLDHEKVGVILGSGIGGVETIEEQHNKLLSKGPGRVSPFFIPMMLSNMAAGQVAIMTGAKGKNLTVVSACASATNAVGDAFRAITSGDADVMITGGSEAAISPLAFAGFCSMKAMSTRNDDPKTASRPFDAERDGFIMGEGSGILVLEELEHALNRGANILAEVVGYGSTDDAHHVTAPAPAGEGGARAMKEAVEDAGIKPEEIDYINAHGTSTPLNDKNETAAIKSVFGEHAYKLAVSSTKSMTGHLLGAAGAIEAIICVLALRDGFIPPTINYKNPDSECDLDIVANEGRQKDIQFALSNSLGFGGHNATIILKKY